VLDECIRRHYGCGSGSATKLVDMLLEVVASTVDDCIAAESGDADRVELCAAISTGGLTPSLGTLIEAKKRVRIPVMALLRPRAGGFCYSDQDFASMQRDGELLLKHGADGIVFGVLHSDGVVDTERCGKLVEIADGKQTVFHRALDAARDPSRALEELIDLGFTRVLTSGQKKTAVEGRELIGRLIVQAGPRIEVLAGGGVRVHNVRQLVEAAHCTQIHMTAFSARIDASTSASGLSFGEVPDAPSGSYEHVDILVVRHMRETLDAISPRQAL
jgi:copper homeostasis protein